MIFSALGGTDRVGASCYFLQLAGTNFLLDCGKGVQGYHTYGPNFLSLNQIPGMESPSRTDALLISHGHYDHIGYLPDFADMCPYTPVYATQTTKEMGKHLMWDRFRYEKDATWEKRMGEDYLVDKALQRIHGNGYGSSFTVGNVKITFYEAGHIPGAAMIYLESPEGNVLYTGDFMRERTMMTSGYQLPLKVQPDLMILCGLHAKHPHYVPKAGISQTMKQAAKQLYLGKSAFLQVKQLTKGLEVVRMIADMMEKGELPYETIFADEQIFLLAERLGTLNMRMLPQNCRPYDVLQLHDYNRPKGIYIGGCFGALPSSEADFSLHADYSDCRQLIERYCPSVVFVVHSPKGQNEEEDTLLAEEFPNIQMIYPEAGRVYGNH